MKFMTAKEWFEKAKKEGFAIGAFNVDNLEILNAICLAAKNKNSPIMLEFSAGEVGYFGIDNIVDIARNARDHFGIPVLLNLDHSKLVEDCLAAVSAGFDDLHFDGSEMEYAQNVEEIKKVIKKAHAEDILVEGEIDHLPGSSEVHAEELDIEAAKKAYTKPDRAAEFVKETHVDIFASVFGNVHGTFPQEPDLDFHLLKKIKEAIPGTFLSMHGGSGIPADQVREAIKVGGIVKVNVNTEIRQAFHDALTEKMKANPDEVAYYKMTPDIVNAVAAVVEGKIDVFGSANKAE